MMISDLKPSTPQRNRFLIILQGGA